MKLTARTRLVANAKLHDGGAAIFEDGEDKTDENSDLADRGARKHRRHDTVD